MERNTGLRKKNEAGSWSPSLDYNIGESFSELILGKNKLGISEKWKGGIGTEVFCRKALRKESLEGNFENVRGLGAAWE